VLLASTVPLASTEIVFQSTIMLTPASQKRLTVDFTVRATGLDLSDTVPLEFKHQVLKSPTIHTGNTSTINRPGTRGIYSQGRKAEDGRIDELASWRVGGWGREE
jgi:hypothetical protein